MINNLMKPLFLKYRLCVWWFRPTDSDWQVLIKN